MKTPKLTKILLNDLKGRREVYYDQQTGKTQQKVNLKKYTGEKTYNETTNHTKYMPKASEKIELPKKQKPKTVPRKNNTVIIKKINKTYLVLLKNGKNIECDKIAIQRDKIITTRKNNISRAVPIKYIKEIKEIRTRSLVFKTAPSS